MLDTERPSAHKLTAQEVLVIFQAVENEPAGELHGELVTGKQVRVTIDPPHNKTFVSWADFKNALEQKCRAESADISVLLKPYNEVCTEHGFNQSPVENYHPVELESNMMMLQIHLQQKIDATKVKRDAHRDAFMEITDAHAIHYPLDKRLQLSLEKRIKLSNRNERKSANFHARSYVESIRELKDYDSDLAKLKSASERIFPKENKLFDDLYPKAVAIVKDALRTGFDNSDPMVIHTMPAEHLVFARWNWSHPENCNFLIDTRAFSQLLQKLSGKDFELCNHAFWRTTSHSIDQVSEAYPQWGFCAGWTGYDKYQPAIRPDECLGPKRVMSEFRAFDNDTNYNPESYISLQDYMGEMVRNIRAIILLRATESTTLSGEDSEKFGFVKIFKTYKVDAESHSTTMQRIDRLQSPRGLLIKDIKAGSEGARDINDLLDALKVFTPKLIQHILLQNGSFSKKLPYGHHLMYVTPNRANHRHNRKLDIPNNGISAHDLLERNLGCKVYAGALQKAIMDYAALSNNSPWEKVILDAAAAALCNVPPMQNAKYVHNNIPITKVRVFTPADRKQEEVAKIMGHSSGVFSLTPRKIKNEYGPPNVNLQLTPLKMSQPDIASRKSGNGHHQPK